MDKMTKALHIDLMRQEAFNKIRKLYVNDSFSRYTYYPGEGSHSEQRDNEVENIINNLEKEIKKLK
jgi:hypothetical protein